MSEGQEKIRAQSLIVGNSLLATKSIDEQIYGMDMSCRLLSVLTGAALLAGCAGSRTRLGSDYGQAEIASVRSPFLAGVPGYYLSNLPAFSARINLEAPVSSAGGHPQSIDGTVLGSENRFLFVPTKSNSSGKHGLSKGGTGFIWNVRTTNGFVLNEPLQAYSPFTPAVQLTNINIKPNVAATGPERISGHACRVVSGQATMSDGSNVDFTVWQAEDLKGFPLRIKSVNGTRQTILNFSDIRFEVIDADLFLPPDGFAQFPNPRAMLDELLRRQNRSGSEGQGRDFDDSTSWTPHDRGGRY